MSVRIGINPLTWTIDDLPEVGGETSLETCLTEARAAGFDGVELGCKFPRTAPELKAALAPHGLALVSGWYSTNLLRRDAAAEFEAMRPHRELLAALGCNVIVVAETTRCIHGERGTRLSQRPVLAPADWPRFAERLDELGVRLQDVGLTLAYHHHMGTVVQTEDEIDRLMDSCDDAVSLLLDTGHLSFAGGDPVRAAPRPGDVAARPVAKRTATRPHPGISPEHRDRDQPDIYRGESRRLAPRCGAFGRRGDDPAADFSGRLAGARLHSAGAGSPGRILRSLLPRPHRAAGNFSDPAVHRPAPAPEAQPRRRGQRAGEADRLLPRSRSAGADPCGPARGGSLVERGVRSRRLPQRLPGGAAAGKRRPDGRAL